MNERGGRTGNTDSRAAALPGTARRDDYSDIIDLPHHTSAKHPRMAAEMRAAQFAPFAALTGYEDVIEETALRQLARVKARDRMKD